MGVYDSVYVKCPSCGEVHEMQSKSGDCILKEYDLENCPFDVMQNINRHSPVKCDCGLYFDVDINRRIVKEYKTS